MNRASVFELHKRFKEGRESVKDDEWCGRSTEVNTPQLIGQRVRVRIKRFRRKRPALFKSSQWNFHLDNAPIHSYILVTDYLTKMGIKTVSSASLLSKPCPCNFWLFPKLRGCRYETTEEMKEAVTKVIDPLTQKDFHEALQEDVGTVQQVDCSQRRLLRRGLEFHVCTINKSAHTKKSMETYLMILVYIYIYTYIYINIKIEREREREREREIISNINVNISVFFFPFCYSKQPSISEKMHK